MSPSYSAWWKTPIYTYYTAIRIGLYGIDIFAPIPLKIGPLDPYIGPNDPRVGIFALGNICFHKPGSDRDLWVPLKFCHQGGARGPLLPTRLKHHIRGVTVFKTNTITHIIFQQFIQPRHKCFITISNLKQGIKFQYQSEWFAVIG